MSTDKLILEGYLRIITNDGSNNIYVTKNESPFDLGEGLTLSVLNMIGNKGFEDKQVFILSNKQYRITIEEIKNA